MRHLLNQLTTSQKFLLIGVIFLIALAFPAWMTFQADLSVINVANTEQAGLNPAKTTLDIIHLTQEYRQGPKVSSVNDIKTLPSKLLPLLDQVKTYALETKDEVLIQHVTKLINDIRTNEQDPTTYSNLISEELELLESIVDTSTMSLDPDADSFNLIMGTLIAAPNLTENLSELEHVTTRISNGGKVTAQELNLIVRVLGLARLYERNTQAFMAKAMVARPEIEPQIKPVATTAHQSAILAIEKTESQWVLNSTTGDLTTTLKSLNQSVHDQVQMINTAAKVLEQDLTDRAENARQHLVFVISCVVSLSALALILIVVLSRHLLSQLGGEPSYASSVVHRIAEGDFSVQVKTKSGDNTSLLYAMKLMSQSLSTGIGEINDTLAAMARGQFDKRVQTNMNGELHTLKENINACVNELGNTIDSINGAMNQVSHGQLSTRISARTQGDLERLKDSINDTLTGFSTNIVEINQVMAAVAQGQLTAKISGQAVGDFEQLKKNINQSISSVALALSNVVQQTRQVATAASQTSTAINQISDGAQNQATAVGHIMTALRQTVASVTDVTRNTAEASRLSNESLKTVQNGISQMNSMVELVNNIAVNSERISKITEVIEAIANKTNLLSLNAAIEAARAGEHGKGFSVVAEEVGKLASSSAESSQEIAKLVELAVAEAHHAVTAVQKVSQEMAGIEQSSQLSSGMLQRIATALEQQSSAVEEINANVMSLDSIARSNSTASEEITAMVMELAKLAESTRNEVSRFTT